MNAILSFIVCIAMLMSPTGTLPAQPETATTWTISNLTIDVGGETVTLAPEARLTTAMGTEEAQLHFELGSGDRTLMPMSGAINADGVRFTLGTGTRTYTLSDETFMELAGMSEEDARLLDVFGDFFLSYGKVLGILWDQEKYAEYYELSWGLMEEMLGTEFEETEVEVEGEMLPALQIEGDLTLTGILNVLDVAAECGIAELEEFVAVTKDMLNLVSGTTIEKFTDLVETVEAEEGLENPEAPIMEMSCVYTTGDPLYSKMDMIMSLDGQEMTAQSESITHGEDTVALMLMEMNAENAAMSYAITMDYTGPVTAPTRLQMSYDILNEMDYSDEYTDEYGNLVRYTSKDSTSMRMTVDAETVDGLEAGTAELVVDNIGSYGHDDELSTYGQTFGMVMDYSEALEEDGSITASIALEVDAMDDTLGLSFDVNYAEGELADYFADTVEQPLSADTEDAGYNMLMADLMGVTADGMALAADESVMELIAMFERLTGMTEYDESFEEDVVTVEDESTTVATLEEAAAIFGGSVPYYTAPEGYELTGVLVDEYSLYATYVSGENEFELCLYNDDTMPLYYSMKDDGVYEAIEGLLVEMDVYGDEVGSATVSGDGREVTFYFYSSMDIAAAEEIIAGLV